MNVQYYSTQGDEIEPFQERAIDCGLRKRVTFAEEERTYAKFFTL